MPIEKQRIIIALLLSFLIHAAIFAAGSRKTLPHISINSAPKRISMRLYRRKAPPQPTPEKINKITPATIRTITRAIHEIPALAPPHPAQTEETGTAMRTPARVNARQPSAAREKNIREPNEKEADDNGDDKNFVPTVLARPLYRENPPPQYPARARLMRWQGTVMINAGINAEGRVTNAVVADSSGHRILDRAALTAVRSWIFTPARRGPARIACEVTVPVRFLLR